MADDSPKDVEQLPPEVLWLLQKSDGYMDLKMREQARKELDEIPEEYRSGILYRQAKLRLALETANWPEAAVLARQLRDRMPKEPLFWIQLAFSIRRSETLEAARSILLEGIKHFPDIAVFPFNLACYECKLGNRSTALDYLKRAIQMDSHFKEAALEDADLEELWSEIDK